MKVFKKKKRLVWLENLLLLDMKLGSKMLP